VPGKARGRAPHFAFDAEEFRPTPSWIQLSDILTGNGGAFAIYGPRGSGTSWLMLRAIHGATEESGIGLWFPCPSNHDASELLSALADNLASAVERRFAGDARPADARGWPLAVGGLAIILFLAQLAFRVAITRNGHQEAVPKGRLTRGSHQCAGAAGWRRRG
jgi:hypothetical protein